MGDAPAVFEGAYWVTPQLLAGPHPVVQDAQQTEARLVALLNAGVNMMVDLSAEAERAPYQLALARLAAARGRPVRHLRYAIPDMRVPSADQMRAILDTISAALSAGETVYVHCLAGLGRTGTVVGCFLVRQGASGSAALNAIRALRGGLTDSPETDAQRRMVRAWRE